MLSNFSVQSPADHTHIESLLLDLVVGTWQPTPSEEAHLIDHLIECIDCKIVLAAFILHMEDDCSDEFTEFPHDILRLLAQTIH